MSKRSAGQGGVCDTGSLLLKPFGEIAVRQDSPRPSGTPLINAGGKGIVLAFGSQLVATEYQEIATACGLAMTVVVEGWVRVRMGAFCSKAGAAERPESV